MGYRMTGLWNVPSDGIPPVSMTLFVDGDTTITWDPENDAAIRSMIETRMKEGYVFLVVEPASIFGRMMGRKPKQVRVDDVRKIKTGQEVIIPTALEDALSKDFGAAHKITTPHPDGQPKVSVFPEPKAIPKTSDEMVNGLIKGDDAKIVGPSSGRGGTPNVTTTRTAKTVDDVLTHHTVAIPRFRGG